MARDREQDGWKFMRLREFLKAGFRDLTTRPPGSIPALDVLRTLAVMMVFTGHFGLEYNASPRFARLLPFRWGWSGVDLFFVLSGLLIGSQLWRELHKTGHIAIGRFALRRGLRIWPLYFSMAAFFALGLLPRTGGSLLPDVFFVSNYVDGQIGGGWSLSTEEQFYILAPLSLALLARKLDGRRLWILPAIGFLLPMIARYAYAGSAHPGQALRTRMYYPFHLRSEGLALGMLLAWISVYRPRWLAAKPRAISALAMLAGGIVLYAWNRDLLNFTTLALVYGSAVCWGVGLPSLSGFLRWRGFYVISRLSYGIYLNHLNLMGWLHGILGPWRDGRGDFTFWMCYLICFIASMGIAWITFHIIEWPFLALRTRWLAASRARLAELQPTS